MERQLKKLSEICKVVGGGTPKTKVSEYWSGDLCWVTPKDLGKHTNFEISETERKITEEGLKNSSAQKLPIGSVILSSRAPIGYVAVNAVPMATNQGCRSFVCGPEIFNKYLYYFLLGNTEYLNSLGSGSTFREVSGSKLKEIEIPLPPLKEQKRIVKILDEKLGAVREAIALRESALTDTEKILSARLREIFEEGKEKGWEVQTFEEILDFKTGKLDSNAKTSDGEYPFFTCAQQTYKIDSYSYDQEAVLLAGNNAAGVYSVKHYKGKFDAYQRTYIITPKNESQVSYLYLKSYLNHILNDLKEKSVGANTKFLTMKILNKIEIPLPNLKTQQKIVSELDELSARVAELRALQADQLADLKRLEKAYLREAFNGEL